MKFARAHKAASYFTVAAAFGALVTGGTVSPITALLGVSGLITSWFWEPPRIRYERWALLWTIVSLLVLVLSVTFAVATGDILGTGADFLVWLTIVKAHNRRAARDWQQLYVLAFFMLVAGSVMNAELAFGACFLLFVIGATWTMILFHLRREMEDNFLLKHADDRSERVEVRRILESKRIVDRRFFVGTGLVSLGIFAGAALLFLSIPRIGVGFFWKGKSGLSLAGFSDGVKLGGHGRIKDDRTVVMRVKVSGKLAGRDAPSVHWRGVAFDDYSHGAWSRGDRAPTTSADLETPRPGRLRATLPAFSPGGLAGDRARATGFAQEVWLEPLDADVLFGASMPLAFEVDAVRGTKPPDDDRNDEVRYAHGGAIHYQVWSQVEAPDADRLRAARGPLPAGFEVYTRVPAEITAATIAKARAITAGITNDYDKAQALIAWLDANNRYTLDLADPDGREPIDFFLFERHAGHCEYFASAFVIMARAVGIPTRNVNGFLGGEWNEYDDYFAIRAGDAHSWAEIYFPGEGWVTFDPTPAADVDELGRGGTGIWARIRRFLDSVRFGWKKWVVDYDLSEQLSLFKGIGGAITTAAHWLKATAIDGAKGAARRWPLTVPLGLAVLAALIWRLRRRRAAIDGPRARARTRTAIATTYAAVLAQLARRGHPRDPAATPRELARDLAARNVAGAPELAELTELYYLAEWGESVAPDAVARATELGSAIIAALAAAARAASR
jgi:transglutaminase-like putative cysteine protease